MSGIIGSAGSKSGIIGSTEIPGGYEEGTWTPTNGGSGWSHSAGTTNTYVKIGKMVTCYIYIQVSNGNTNNLVIASLPFTSDQYSFTSSTNCNHGTNAAGFNSHFRMNSSSTQMNLCRTDNGSLPYADNFNGTHAIFSVSYKAAS